MNVTHSDSVYLLCPRCGVGHLRATRFKAKPDSSPRIQQLGDYAFGGIRPTIVAECTHTRPR